MCTKDPSMQERNVFSASCILVKVFMGHEFIATRTLLWGERKEHCVIVDTFFHTPQELVARFLLLNDPQQMNVH